MSAKVNETVLYFQMLPKLESVCRGLPTPLYYHASKSDQEESVLVLEDLSSKSFKTRPLSRGLDKAEACSALSALAKIHAASIIYEKRHLKSDLRQEFPFLMSQNETLDCFQHLVNRGVPLLTKFLQNKPEYKTIRSKLLEYASGDKISKIISRAFEPSPKLNSIVHCDFWINNLLFCGPDPPLCCIIDWQLVTYGKPAIDVALLLTTSLSHDLRKELASSEDDILVQTYWQELNSNMDRLVKGSSDEKLGKDKLDKVLVDYDISDLKDDLKQAKAMSALVMVGSVDLALGIPQREQRLLSTLDDYIKEGIL